MIEKLLGWQPGQTRAEANSWLTLSSWFAGYGDSTAGIAVDPDTALKVSTVFACVGLLSETIASLPLVIYRYMENDMGRERARNHPLYEVLHSQPNDQQTAFDFVQMMQAHALLRGSGYAEIRPGPRGFADQLVPLHPDNVQKEKLASGRVRFRIRDEVGRERPLNQEDVFEVGGLSLDGWNTVSVVAYARDSLGLSLAAERYGSRFFRNDSRPGGVLTTDGTIKEDAAKRIKSDWEALHASANQHRVAVLEQGLKWQQVGISPEEAQFLGTREHQAEDVCRWFRVPPHMVGLTSKATSWGSGIEEMNLGFLAYTLRPWLTRWVQAIRRDLILAQQTYFADFVIQDLLRGDIEKRYNAYAIGIQNGWLNRNEVRRFENMNSMGPKGDVYLQPLNMSDASQANAASPPGEHYRLLAEEAAARVVRKEIAAMTRAAKGDDFENQVRQFYQGHVSLVAQTMRIPQDKALAYCIHGRDMLLAHGVEVMKNWEPERVIALAETAMRRVCAQTGDEDGE